jgi:GT2 family glycosyltransferase
VLSYDHPFNYSAINNYGVRHAKGSILGLINDDIEVIHGDWLREMVSHAFRPEIGCVGAKLLYPDGTIQHGGVIIGLGGIAGHAYKYQPGDSPGYFRRLQVAHAVSAVTAACLVVKRSIYQEVRGMDETHLPIAFNDVDFCLKVREAGYRNLLTPHAVLVHHESATRGSDEEPEKRERFQLERTTMRDRWRHMLFDDPYHSPHLSLDRHDYVIRVPDLVA